MYFIKYYNIYLKQIWLCTTAARVDISRTKGKVSVTARPGPPALQLSNLGVERHSRKNNEGGEDLSCLRCSLLYAFLNKHTLINSLFAPHLKIKIC